MWNIRGHERMPMQRAPFRGAPDLPRWRRIPNDKRRCDPERAPERALETEHGVAIEAPADERAGNR
jgi:hypothetical protein